MSRTMVPMPDGVILHPRLIADVGYWWSNVRISMQVYGKRWRPLKSLRYAVYRANHGTKHNGQVYRCCYRWKWLESSRCPS